MSTLHLYSLGLVALFSVNTGSANEVVGTSAVVITPAPVSSSALERLVVTLHAQRLVADTLQQRVYRETARRMGIAQWETVTPPSYYTAVMGPRMAGLPLLSGNGEPMMVSGLTYSALRVTFLQPTFQRNEGLIAHEAVHQLRGDIGSDHTNWPTNAAPLNGMDAAWRAGPVPTR